MEPEKLDMIPSRDFLNSFMEVLANKEGSPKNVYVENSTNTEEINTEMNKPATNTTNRSDLSVRNTSDLLDSLQKALSFGNTSNNLETDKEADNLNINKFKAYIIIDSALHLPSRRKCKSKRNRIRGAKHSEEILPSTYVTFKTFKNFVVTPVIAKNTSPRWDFRYESHFPTDLLLNVIYHHAS